MSKLHKRGKEKQLVYKVKYYDKEKCKPYEKSGERALVATELPVSELSKILKEGLVMEQSSSKVLTSDKEEKNRKIFLSHDELCAFREIIENIYEDMEIPTVRKIIRIARKNLNFEGSRAKVRGILRNKLGFKFNQHHPNNNIVLERNWVKLLRINYLQSIKKNDALGKNKKPLVYVGECLIKKVSSKNGKQATRRGPKWLIFFAGSENGFIGDELLYKYTLKKENPATEDFLKFIENNVIPKLPTECIVVMNSSPLHDMEVDAIPTMMNTKEYIKQWIINHNIPFEEDMLKAELIVAIKKTYPIKKYAVDELLARYGHKVLRIPYVNTDLNPLEYVGTKIILRVAEERKGDLDVIEDLISKALRSITAEDWKERINHVKKIEERYWVRDAIKEEEFEHILDSIGMLSDTDSSSESEMEYWSSSSSEESDDDGSANDWTDIDDNSNDSII